MSRFHFYRWNQFSLSPKLYAPHKKKYVPKFSVTSDVRYCALKFKTNSTLQCWCGLASDILKNQTELETEISNTVHNAGIAQSNAGTK